MTRTEIDNKIKDKCIELGFKKRKGCFCQPIGNETIATLLFGISSFAKSFNVNVFVGLINKKVEDIAYQLTGYSRLVSMQPQIGLQIGYLMPENAYKSWLFSDMCNSERILDEIFFNLIQYGLPYQRYNSSFDVFFDTICNKKEGKSVRQKYLPILYYMRGEKEKGQQVIDAAIKEMQRPKTDGELLVGVPDSVQNKTKIFRVGLDTVSNNDLNQMVKTMPSESAIVFAGSGLNGFVDPEYLKFAERYKALP